MCGIVGFVSRVNRISEETLAAMRDTLMHRGPDDAGIQMFNQEAGDSKLFAGLAHRRLSIIDLSSAGKQPMANEDGKVWITYNGECYNFQSLRQKLAQRGHIFRSATDTEVVVHGYEEWGIEELLNKLNGMLAFALWDDNQEKLFLARDRVGKKPLYYVIEDDGTLVFASEIKALIRGGFVDPGDIEEAALVQFWLYGYTTGEQTVFRKVRRLLPGHYAVWQKGKLATHNYWDCIFDFKEDRGRAVDDYCDELEDLLLDAIRLRMIADVPVGVFLSGGVDSSLIAALAARITGSSLRSFSIGFSENKFDESFFAQSVADHLGIENKRLQVHEDLQDSFRSIALHFDELFGDSSAVPTYFVSKLARKHATVALTGDGGDELFAGYDSYAKALSIWGSQKERKLFKGRASALQKSIDWLQLRFVPQHERLSALERIMPLVGLRKVFSEEVMGKTGHHEALAGREQWYSRVAEVDLLSQMQYVNLKTYLPDDILVKVDRMSMFNALECRSPLLDYRVVEFASRLPFSMKIGPQGERKFLLRRLLGRYIPQKMIDRPKMGFIVPWSEWCQGPLGMDVKTKWQEMGSSFFNPKAAEYLFPAGKLGWPARQWNAYCTVHFFSMLKEKGQHKLQEFDDRK